MVLLRFLGLVLLNDLTCSCIALCVHCNNVSCIIGLCD